MATKMLVFSPEALRDLLIHYNDGKDIPLGATIKGIAMSSRLQRWIQLLMDSDSWEAPDRVEMPGVLVPLFYRYEGRKTLSWQRGREEGPVWAEKNEAPRLQ